MRTAAALLLLALTACTPIWEGREMKERITKLEGSSESSARQLEEQKAAVKDRIASVDRKIDELNAAARRSGADLAVNQDKLIDDVARLRGQLEELAHRLDTIEAAEAQQKSDIEGRFAALKGAGALDEFEARKRAEQLKRPTDKAQFLALAQETERKGDRLLARQLYGEFVKNWPTDPRAADAHFRLGELYYGDRQYRSAVVEYGKVAQDFPRSDKAPDALLRTGESMLALELPDDARRLFEEVRKQYPNTTAAQRAKARLAELTPKKNGKKK